MARRGLESKASQFVGLTGQSSFSRGVPGFRIETHGRSVVFAPPEKPTAPAPDPDPNPDPVVPGLSARNSRLFILGFI